MHYIVLDVEATDNKRQEIIEIAACKIDSNLNIIDKYRSYVKPIDYRLSWYIEKLTNIKIEFLEREREFREVFSEFDSWAGEDSCFITWGKDDRRYFARDLELHKMSGKILNRFVNIQSVVSKHLGSTDPMGLVRVLKALDLEFEGEQHRALDDALNTAKIFTKTFNIYKIENNKIGNFILK